MVPILQSTKTGLTYSISIMLEKYLFAQLETDSDNLIYQQDGVPQHWNLHVRVFKCQTHHRPLRSPDLTICDQGGEGACKRQCFYISPLPTTLDEMKNRMQPQNPSLKTCQLRCGRSEYRVDIIILYTYGEGGGILSTCVWYVKTLLVTLSWYKSNLMSI